MAIFAVELVVGRSFRDAVVHQIKRQAFLRGLQVDLTEDRGWLESHYCFRVSGDDDKVVSSFQTELSRWIRELAQEAW